MAVEKNIDADKLEKLIALRNQEIARMAKEEFDIHFSEMQSEFPRIEKNKKATKDDGRTTMYVYAPLEALQAAVDGIIHAHKFSYRWREEERQDGGKRIRIIISGYGHTDDQTFFDVPKIEATKWQNAIQVMGTMSSYGRRYTFIAGFGLTIEGEDDESQIPIDDAIKYFDQANIINGCKTMEDLKKVFPEVYRAIGSDPIGQRYLTKIKDAKKKELSNGTKN